MLDFPDHPISLLLKEKIPNYERWALGKRRWVVEEEAKVEQERVQALNAASLYALEGVHRRQDALTGKVLELNATMTQVKLLLERIDSNLSTNGGQQTQLPGRPDSDSEQRDVSTPTAENDTARNQPGQNLARSNDDDVTAPPEANDNEQEPPALEGPSGTQLPPSVPIPAFTTQMPNRMIELLQVWTDRNLEAYVGRNQRDWPSKITQAFNKFHYLIKTIKARADRLKVSMFVAAQSCDKERKDKGIKGRTLYQYFLWLKAQDANVVRRRKRRRTEVDDDVEGNIVPVTDTLAGTGVGQQDAEEADVFSDEDDLPIGSLLQQRQQQTAASRRPQTATHQATLRQMFNVDMSRRQQLRHPRPQMPSAIGWQMPRRYVNLSTQPRPSTNRQQGARGGQSRPNNRRRRLTVVQDQVLDAEAEAMAGDGSEGFNQRTSGGAARWRP